MKRQKYLSPPTESLKRILLDHFENGQELIDSFKPNSPICRKCGNPPSVKLIVEKEYVMKKLIQRDGELIWSMTSLDELDQTQPPNPSTEYLCSKCYEKIRVRRRKMRLKWLKDQGLG